MKKLVLVILIITVVSIGWAARKALIIGNSNYADSPLRNPVNDAEDIATALSRLGYSVSKHNDLSYAAFDQAVRDFSSRISSGDEVIFFYGGHGVEVDGSNYLIPVRPKIESEVDCREYAINAAWVLGRLEAAEILVFILDACRDNPFKGTRTSSRGLASMSTKAGSTVLVYATEPGKVASDGSGSRNSPFTQALLGNLDHLGTIDDLLIETSRDLLALTKGTQRMWRAGSLNDYYSLSRGKLSDKRDLALQSVEADTLSYDSRIVSHIIHGDGEKHGELEVSFSFPAFSQDSSSGRIINRNLEAALINLLELETSTSNLAEAVEKTVQSWKAATQDYDFYHLGEYRKVILDVALNGRIITVAGLFIMYWGGVSDYSVPLHFSYDLSGNLIPSSVLIPATNRTAFESLLIYHYRRNSKLNQDRADERILTPYSMYLSRDGLVVIYESHPRYWPSITIPRSEIYYLLSDEVRRIY